MDERKFWLFLRSKLDPIKGFHFDRIESHMTPGIPDVAYSFNPLGGVGHHGWLELKVFNSGRHHLTNAQRLWLDQRDRSGGNVWLVMIERKSDHWEDYVFGMVKGANVSKIPGSFKNVVPKDAYSLFLENYKSLTSFMLAGVL